MKKKKLKAEIKRLEGIVDDLHKEVNTLLFSDNDSAKIEIEIRYRMAHVLESAIWGLVP